MIGVDVGGTFTDVVAVRNGEIRTVKVPTNVRDTEQGVLRGAQDIGVSESQIFNHASTHGLNAVITRRLPKIAFLTTLGHRDILDMGRTWRPVEGLTDAAWRRPFGDAARPLVPRYLRRGIRERITASGDVLFPIDEEQAREELRTLQECDVAGVAVCLINAYVTDAHEARLRDLIREELGDEVAVSISSEVSPLAKEFARASSTVVDVLMKLIYGKYTDRLDSGLRDLGFTGDLNYADCAAHLVPAEVAMRQPFRIVFAGPAAGTMSSAHFGSQIDLGNLLCCDVGGTSADISLVTAGVPFVNTSFELEHDLIVNALSNEVSSIGAGGGSLITIGEVGELRVGPGSAGADPGPACYGIGGEQPTMTDACLLIGIIDPDGFAGGRMTLKKDLAEQAFAALDTPIGVDQRVRHAFDIGINNIAEGVVNIAIQHGIDPRDYSLVAYGAAGPMLLPAVLGQVRAREVVVPPHPGLFSALGLVSSDLVYSESRCSYTLLDGDAAPHIDAIFTEMEEALRSRLRPEEREKAVFVRSLDGRLVGQSWETPFVEVPEGTIDAAAMDQLVRNFHKTYGERWSKTFEMMPVQGVTYRVDAQVPADKVSYPEVPRRTDGDRPSAPVPTRSLTLRYLSESDQAANEYARVDLRQGDRIAGPAVIREPMSTTFVLAGQTVEVGRVGELRITREES
ncbi:hydantoinase/oxoprolinase family protein [Pseudonocardia xishanensis]|uniref:Hydantoinase/oxoprolinase family protein n=1 Tax=Pseudonocardia xishanensis TaxID=630995 RepID=A0ABP8RX38_9PSEU